MTRGLDLNRTNPALNRDMQRILDGLAAREGAPGHPAGEASSGESAHVLLSAYPRPTR